MHTCTKALCKLQQARRPKKRNDHGNNRSAITCLPLLHCESWHLMQPTAAVPMLMNQDAVQNHQKERSAHWMPLAVIQTMALHRRLAVVDWEPGCSHPHH